MQVKPTQLYYGRHYDQPLAFIYGFFICVWAAAIVQGWHLKQKEIAAKWQVDDFQVSASLSCLFSRLLFPSLHGWHLKQKEIAAKWQVDNLQVSARLSSSSLLSPLFPSLASSLAFSFPISTFPLLLCLSLSPLFFARFSHNNHLVQVLHLHLERGGYY